MDLNLTLLGQMITFAIFVWFTMKFVFPPIMKAMKDREDKIAAGLAAAEQGEASLILAQQKAKEELNQTREETAKIIAQAHQRASKIIEDSKVQAVIEGERLIQQAKHEIDREYQSAKRQLLKQVSNLVVIGSERILNHEVDLARNDRLVADLVKEI